MSRYFIYIGSPSAPGYTNLGRVESDLEQLCSCLEGDLQQYKWILKDISIGSTAKKIREEVENWFAATERKASDEVIIYVAGHGAYEEGNFREHKLVLVDSKSDRPSSYLKVDELVDLIFDGSNDRPHNVLMILDVCYAGRSGAKGMAHYQRQANSRLEGQAGFYIISSAGADFEAEDGGFAGALIEVLTDDIWRRTGKYISVLDIVADINRVFQARKNGQQAIVSLANATEGSRFFLNKLNSRDLTHWDLKARGNDFTGDRHWFFCGRRRVLEELNAWLNASSNDGRVRFVVGDPGSGKSAILARLYLSSLNSVRKDLISGLNLQEDDETLARPGAIKVALNARGQDLMSLIKALSVSVGKEVNNLYDLSQVLESMSTTTGILIDSLDEAVEVSKIENDLLPMLGHCRMVRLIVASRRTNAVKQMSSIVIDIDESSYFSEEEVTAYISSRIRTELNENGVLFEEKELAPIAESIARKADRSFLYARVVALTVAQNISLQGANYEKWAASIELPATLNQAFERDLERFASDKREELLDLLTPLAYSKGKGLPAKNIWITVANRIARNNYSNDSIRELKRKFGYYLVEDNDEEVVVYRLFHQAFADFLKNKTKDEDIELKFTEALLSLRSSDRTGVQSWAATSEPYLLKYFVVHAANAGLLEKMLLDPDFLLDYPFTFILPHLHTITSASGERLAKAFRRASTFAGKDKELFTGQLLLKAYEYGAHNLVNVLRSLNKELDWTPAWCAWGKSISSYTVANSKVALYRFIVYVDEIHGPIAVCYYSDGSLKLWKLENNKLLEEYDLTAYWPQEVREYVNDLSIVRHNGIFVIACVSGSGFLLLINDRKVHLSEKYNIQTKCVQALLVSDLGELRLFVVAEMEHRENIFFESWLLPDFHRLTRIDHAFNAAVYGLTTTIYKGKRVLLSSGDTVSAGKQRGEAPLQIRSLDSLEVIWQFDKNVANILSDIKPFTWNNQLWILGQSFGHIWLINPDNNHSTDVTEGYYGGIVGYRLREDGVDLLSAVSQQLKVATITRENDGISRLSRATGLRMPADYYGNWIQVELHGRLVVIHIDERSLRIWDFEELFQAGTLNTADTLSLSGEEHLSGGVISGDFYVAFAASGTIFRWKKGGGQLPVYKCEKDISGLDAFVSNGRPALFIAFEDASISMLDTESMATLPDNIRLEDVCFIYDLQIVEVNNRQILVAAVNNNKAGTQAYSTVRRWDLASGTEILMYNDKDKQLIREFCLNGYYVEKRLSFVRSLSFGDREYYVFGAPNGELAAFDGNGIEICSWNDSRQGIYGTCCAIFSNAFNVLVASGDERGTLSLFNVTELEHVVDNVKHAHSERITAITTAYVNHDTVIITGGNDGLIHFWSYELERCYTIELESEVLKIEIDSSRLFIVCIDGVVCIDLNWNEILK